MEKELQQMYSIGTSEPSDFFISQICLVFTSLITHIILKLQSVIKAGNGRGVLCGGAPPMYLIPLFSAFYCGNGFGKNFIDSWDCYRKILPLEKKNFL